MSTTALVLSNQKVVFLVIRGGGFEVVPLNREARISGKHFKGEKIGVRYSPYNISGDEILGDNLRE